MIIYVRPEICIFRKQVQLILMKMDQRPQFEKHYRKRLPIQSLTLQMGKIRSRKSGTSRPAGLLVRQILERQCHQIFWVHWTKIRNSGALIWYLNLWGMVLANEELYLGTFTAIWGWKNLVRNQGILLEDRRGKVQVFSFFLLEIK